MKFVLLLCLCSGCSLVESMANDPNMFAAVQTGIETTSGAVGILNPVAGAIVAGIGGVLCVAALIVKARIKK
jgi:hypothetical protein